MSKFCPHCGCEYGKEDSHDENAVICTKTGLALAKIPPSSTDGGRRTNKVLAGWLALLGGALGLHKFYHGSWGWGIVYVSILLVLGESVLCTVSLERTARSRLVQLSDDVRADAKRYVRTHFTYPDSLVKEYFKFELFAPGDRRFLNSEDRNIWENLADSAYDGRRQSPDYKDWIRARRVADFWGHLFIHSIVWTTLATLFFAIIGIIDGITYWLMSKEQYHTRYNETPRRAFKW